MTVNASQNKLFKLLATRLKRYYFLMLAEYQAVINSLRRRKVILNCALVFHAGSSEW